MPRHVDELRNDDPFPVQPGTNEYEALSFLVSNREYGFRPTEIAARTEVTSSSASKTMARLFEKGLVERAEGVYYVEPERADDFKRRLDSIDAATRLFAAAPEDDAYAANGWDDDLPSIEDADRDDETGTSSTDESDPDAEAEALVDRLAGDDGNGA